MLRRTVTELGTKIKAALAGRSQNVTQCTDDLARDFAVNREAMSDLLDRTVAKVAAIQASDFDPHSFMAEVRAEADSSISQISVKLEREKIQAHLDQMDELSKRIYNLHQEGHKHNDIAQRTNTDVKRVREILARIYIDLEMVIQDQGQELVSPEQRNRAG